MYKLSVSLEMPSKEFARCRCFLTRNYYSSILKSHVKFENEESFCENYSQMLRGFSKTTIDTSVAELVSEKQRRLNEDECSFKRREEIMACYVQKHPDVYTLTEHILHHDFLQIVNYCKQPDANLQGLLLMLGQLSKAESVYYFPVFTQDFVTRFLEEIENFEQSDMPKGRPNTMNNSGVLLNELGFDEGLLIPLQEDYLSCITRILYPDYGGGNLDSHKAFTVSYSAQGDLDLDLHYDNAEVTLNVSLGKEFEGGELYFGKMRGIEPMCLAGTEPEYAPAVHKPTWGVLHRGQHMHGAMPITHGERHNLIIWIRSSSVRNVTCPMCDRTPDLSPVKWGSGDGFTVDTVEMCAVT